MAKLDEYKFFKSDEDVPAAYNYYMYLKPKSYPLDTTAGAYIMRLNSANTESLYAFMATAIPDTVFTNRASQTYKNLGEWSI